jgi:hypothetical protein
MGPMNAHRLAEERSLELHRKIAEMLRRDPEKLAKARSRVHGWLQDRSVHPHYAEAWARLIDGPFEELLRALVDESENARAMRQATPFAGYVDPRTRWQIWREVRDRMSRPA